MKQSFYDWCVNTQHQSFLLRWDYDKNKVLPSEVSMSDIHKYYFKCEDNIEGHESELHDINHIVIHEKIPKCSICGSFGYWCDTHARQDLLKRWDFDKNTISPYQISIFSTKKQYFKCPRGIHDSELKDLNNIRKQYGSTLCSKCQSIGQFGIDNISKDFVEEYWSDRNKVSAFDINKGSTKKIYIKCQNNPKHPDYEISAVNFQKEKRCPYCAHKKVFLEESLGFLFQKSNEVWSNNNKDTPYDYLPYSNKLVWWKCENGKHNDFRRSVLSMTESLFRCPKCRQIYNESILQSKVRKYLESKFDIVNHEGDCELTPINPETNYPLPYDNEVPEIKLIIEVNGSQHYKPAAIFYKKYGDIQKAFEHRQYLDKLKKQYALNNGYHFLEIPYYYDDRKESWKQAIDTTISKIISNQS